MSNIHYQPINVRYSHPLKDKEDTMQYTTLGHSGIKVSKLCLGGMSFGEPSPDFHQ